MELALGIAFGLCLYAWIATPNSLSFKRDDTDAPKGRRSGMAIYTDQKTGVQYLGTALGGLTLRVDRDGKPMTVKKVKAQP